jgi:TP53 regulating kinase and related kinases
MSVYFHTNLSLIKLQRVWSGTFLSRPTIIKQRFKKTYRHPILDDRLTSQRLRQEVRCMLKARKLGVPTPVVYHVDVTTATIYMQHISGSSLKDVLYKNARAEASHHNRESDVCLVREMAIAVARLHDGGMVHGDLTTSNVLVESLRPEGTSETEASRIVLIDFGLAFLSTLPEDRAVDLYVLERAFLSAHAMEGAALFEEFTETYRRTSRNWCATLNRLADVRLRGRKRSMVG